MKARLLGAVALLGLAVAQNTALKGEITVWSWDIAAKALEAVVPSLPIVREEALEAFREAEGPVLFGPRSGSKTETFQIPKELPPGPLQALLPLKVVRVESLPPGLLAHIPHPLHSSR